MAAANTYRLFTRNLSRFERAQPHRLHHEFTSGSGTIHVDHDHITVALKTRTHTPVLLEAGYPNHDLPIPWLNNRRLRFTFPPR